LVDERGEAARGDDAARRLLLPTLDRVRAGAAGRLVGSLGFVLLAAGCGGGTTSNSAADQSFVAAVHLGAPDIGSFRSNMQLIRLGHAACDAFRAGASYQQIADRMSQLEGRNPLP
jgi:hypothetical protein